MYVIYNTLVLITLIIQSVFSVRHELGPKKELTIKKQQPNMIDRKSSLVYNTLMFTRYGL